MSETGKVKRYVPNFDNKMKIVEIRHREKNITTKKCLIRLGIFQGRTMLQVLIFGGVFIQWEVPE